MTTSTTTSKRPLAHPVHAGDNGHPVQKYWAHVDLDRVPLMKTAAPGPKSRALHTRCTKHFKGLSSQVKLFPVAFDSGYGCVLTDVDGNKYIDFSSGIYVTTLGHCHPKVSEAIAKFEGPAMRLVPKKAKAPQGD